MSLLFKSTRISQSQGSSREYNYALRPLFLWDASTLYYEYVSGRNGIQRHGTNTAKPKRLRFLAADITVAPSSGLSFQTPIPSFSVAYPVKIVAYFRPQGITGEIFSRMHSAIAAYAGAWSLYQSGTSLYFRWVDTSGASQSWATGVVLTTGVDICVCIEITPDTINCYKNGAFVSSAAWTPVGQGQDLRAIPTNIGADSYLYNGNRGYVYAVGGVLGGNARDLSGNPWQLFAPQSRALWLPSTVASGGTTDALTSQPITTGAPTLTQAALGQTHALTAQAIDTAAPTLVTPAIGQIHALTSQAIDTAAPTITTPALTAASNVDNLIAQALSTGQITITQATLAQIHVLTSQAIVTSAPTISTPTLTAAANFDNLTELDIATGAPTVSSPAIGQVHALTGGAIACGPATISTGVLGQVHALLTQEIVTGAATISTPTVDAPLVAAMPIGTITFEQIAAAYSFEQLAQAYTFEQISQTYSFGD